MSGFGQHTSTWTRATIEQRCGACGSTVAIGAPLLVLQPRALKRRLVRGVCCAGPAPPDLPDRVVTAPVVPLSLQRLGLLPLSFARQREPGCDD